MHIFLQGAQVPVISTIVKTAGNAGIAAAAATGGALKPSVVFFTGIVQSFIFYFIFGLLPFMWFGYGVCT
jgi:hypothetical protein